jgi:hypothetical protein
VILRLATAIVLICATSAQASDWTLQTISAAGPVKAIETLNDGPAISIGHGWFRIQADGGRLRLVATAGPSQRPLPPNALPSGTVAEGQGEIARAWLSHPTTRYNHGILGDAIEAGSLAIEKRDGQRQVVTLPHDSVFEDRRPRIVKLDGGEKVVVVKSYVERGSALAIVGERDGKFDIVAETPPIGAPHRWLNPAGIADFDGGGIANITLVRMPHVQGVLEHWSFRDGVLRKIHELDDTTNHVNGSRALSMSASADFDGDGRADLAIASFDRRILRIVSFAPQPRDIARIALPSRAATDFALLKDAQGRASVLLGLENGALVLARPAR